MSKQIIPLTLECVQLIKGKPKMARPPQRKKSKYSDEFKLEVFKKYQALGNRKETAKLYKLSPGTVQMFIDDKRLGYI